MEVKIFLFVSQLNIDALSHEKHLLPPTPFFSFSLLAQATLHNLIASFDKYPALVELTCLQTCQQDNTQMNQIQMGINR